MAKKNWDFAPREKIKGHVCSGCIQIFPDKDLFMVTMPAEYSTPFCEPCIKKEGITPDRIKGNYAELAKIEHEKSNPWKKNPPAATT